MKNRKELFSSDDIEVTCPQKMVWDEMEVMGEGRRLCDGCDKVLVDVTGYTEEEVHELQKKDAGVCVAVTNALLVSTLSFSLLAAGGDIEKEEDIIMPVELAELAPVVVGIPPRPSIPPQPICDEGTTNLNAIKRFFGFDVDESCQEED